MSKYTVYKGRTYGCQVKLGWLESFASDETVAEKFRNAGFINVKVSGSSSARRVVGTWGGKDGASAEIPSQVTSIEAFAVARRDDITKLVPAELSIRAAITTVEQLGNGRLTEAIVLLRQAQVKVADFIDGKQPSKP